LEACGDNVLVQYLLEQVMHGHFLLLAAFFVESQPPCYKFPRRVKSLKFKNDHRRYIYEPICCVQYAKVKFRTVAASAPKRRRVSSTSTSTPLIRPRLPGCKPQAIGPTIANTASAVSQ
jgi:hypothetical protein